MSDIVMLEPSELEGKYLTFILMEEQYGVAVGWILQIIAQKDFEITMIPKTPPFVKGVINLRGKIIPVIDLRLKFKLPTQDYNERTSIVVINLKSQNTELFIGIIIDRVLEVLDIDAKDIEKAPSFGVDIETQFILGMAKVKNKVVTLLNIEKILSDEELSSITKL